MNRKWNSRYPFFAEGFLNGFASISWLLIPAYLLLSGCTGFYTSHPVADKNSSDIDPHLAGLWQSIYERDTSSWAAHFSDEDRVTGKLSLFRHCKDYSKTSKATPTNVFSIRCIRRMNKGVCSAKLDGQPVPALKEDMRGWNTFDFYDTWSPKSEIRYVVARYEIKGDGTLAIYASANRKVLEKHIKEKGFASNKAEKNSPLVITEPTPRLKKLLENADEYFGPNATLVMSKKKAQTVKEKVEIWVGQLNKGQSKNRYDAAYQLGMLGEKAKDAVPALTKVIWDALGSEQAMDLSVVRASVEALGRIGVSSQEVLAALEALKALNEKELQSDLEKTIQILKRKRENMPMPN
jgi:hypothetical protein